MAQEKNFEGKVKQFLIKKGCWFLKYWGGASYTKSGIPDLLVCCCGRFLGIELKAKTGKPSELQIYNLRKIDEAGGLGVLLYPDDFDRFRILIEHIVQYEGLHFHEDLNHMQEYQYFRQIRKEWEEKLSVTVHLN